MRLEYRDYFLGLNGYLPINVDNELWKHRLEPAELTKLNKR
jgi:hypothetical protein